MNKDLEIINKDPQEVNYAQEKKEVYMGRFSQRKGHTLFYYDRETKEINECKFEQAIIDINNPDTVRKKLIYNPNFLYISALNKKNAERKLHKMINNENYGKEAS